MYQVDYVDTHTKNSFILIMTKVAIIHYSMYGHVATMSESVKKGVEAAGVTCDIYQVAETLPEEVLGKMHAPPKGDYPIMTAEKMLEYDGFLFGISGRYGMISAQMKVRWDCIEQAQRFLFYIHK